VVSSIAAAGSGHTGGSLGLADVFATLYFHEMQHRPVEPEWEGRDRMILSIGHVAPVLYATLAHAGYFPVEELLSLRKLGSRLQGHPGRDHGLPGLELSAGSLGQGLSVATGMAMTAKMNAATWKVYCILGDGELQEGSVWEAAMAASHHELGRLIAIVDRNGLQIDGRNSDVMELEPLADKWRAFGWTVLECDGNDISSLLECFSNISNTTKPTVILAHTLMGKGVKAIENDYKWHGRAPSPEEAAAFLAELQ
jgi:transketolase